MRNKNFKRTKFTCYFAYVAMASIFSLPPMLFVTLKEMYQISYTLLGTLVLINFCTQLSVDLIFTFFTKYFNIEKTIRAMPLLTAAGLIVYALSPRLFAENIYMGLVMGTIIFSVSAGLCEVLLSPVVAALPSETPEKDMSTLHSLFGWGVVSVVIFSSIFFVVFGRENWVYLTFLWAVLPIVACYLFCTSPIPELNLSTAEVKRGNENRKKELILCAMIIFLGSAAENSMMNWISTYMENVLSISKAVGDVLGMAVFAILLAVTRNVYAKYGKNISKVLLWGMIGAVLCYVTAGLSNHIMAAFVACILTGVCTSMLWPGTLISMEERIPNPGVAAYALMAACGDLGASIAPQLLGVIADKVSVSDYALTVSEGMAITPEQVGIKTGMLVAALFPLVGSLLVLYARRRR